MNLKNIKRFVFVTFGIFAILLSSGCGVKYEKDSEGNDIKTPEGARVVENQITEDMSFKDVWSEDGWFGALLVYPLVKYITFLGETTTSYGLAIIIATFSVRLIFLPLTLKSSRQQALQRDLAPKVTKIRAKYADKKDRESQMRMNAEVQQLYKDNGVSMLGGCLGMLVTMPVFFAFYAAIYRTPGIFDDTFLGLELGAVPRYEIFTNGSFVYILPILLVFGLNFVSMQYSQNANKKHQPKRPYNDKEEKTPNIMQQQMKMMVYFMPVMIAFFAFSLPVGMSVYFSTSALVMIIQTLIVNKEKMKNENK